MTTLTKTQTRAELARQPMDSLLLVLTLMLLCTGVFMVYDASYAFAIEHFKGDSFHYVKRQALSAGVGLACLLVTLRVPYWRWRRVAVMAPAVAALLLIAALIPHVGIAIGGARRWLGHGPVQFQPSELAKLALVLYLARWAMGKQDAARDLRGGLLLPLMVIGALAALIAKEPDLGTALVLAGTGLVMLFLAGARPSHLLGIVGAAAVPLALFIAFEPYRARRITAFLNPRADEYNTGYQIWHSLIALGSGGVTGLGLGEGREKLFIPEAWTDFIFPVLAEEWGLIGTLVLVAVFVLIAMRGYAIAYRTRDPFGALLAAGITTLIALQALVNIAVATASIPDTGVPLPFISYGGTSLVLLMAGMGLLLNISCYPDGPGGPIREKTEPNEDDWNRRWERNSSPLPTEPRPAPTLRRLNRTRRRDAGVWRE